MALKVFPFVITNFLCIYLCYSMPQNLSKISFPNFVLDGRRDCGLFDHDSNVIKLFNIISCPDVAKRLPDDYFNQREILPCFGAYDALYNLCDFPQDKINFTTPDSFKNSTTFCTEAKSVYDHIPFTYNNHEVNEWGQALLSTMKNEALCDNLCVINTEINKQCIAMVTFAHEYIRLKGISGSNVKPPKSNVLLKQPIVNIQTTTSKPPSEDKIHSSALERGTIGSLNTVKPSESTKSTPGNFNTLPKKTDNMKESDLMNHNSKGESKTSDQLHLKAEKPITAVEHNDETNVPETENPEKIVKPSNNDKSVNTSPVSGSSSMPKVPTNTLDEGLIDENDKTVTDIEDFQRENEEAVPIGAKETGNPAHRHFLGSSPFSLLLNVPNSFLNPLKRTCTSHSSYEENEKTNEEEKIIAPDTEQHAAYHGGMAPSFNAMDGFSESEDSYSFTYIVTTMAALCCVYLLFHYRNKLLALALEGRKGRSSRGRGRPSSANYSKLHSNLEEAIASNVTTPSATHVLY